MPRENEKAIEEETVQIKGFRRKSSILWSICCKQFKYPNKTKTATTLEYVFIEN